MVNAKKEFNKLGISVDDYIMQSADFAKPILSHLRSLIRKTLPQISESIKWRMPHFELEGPICFMAAFKNHVSLGFNKYSLLKDPNGFLQKKSSEGGSAMGNLGKISCLEDLPPDKVLIDFLRQAEELNKDGIKVLKKIPQKKSTPTIPDYFLSALKKYKSALLMFNQMSDSCKREYVNWIGEAKMEATRIKRMQQALEWISAGKKRNWKYEEKPVSSNKTNTSIARPKKPAFANFKSYYESFEDKAQQKKLRELHRIIKRTAPEAEEIISYNMPAFRLNKVLVYFAAQKNHIGFYPTSTPIRVFKKELKPYVTSKGAIQFATDKPLPAKLIQEIVRFRITEVLKKK